MREMLSPTSAINGLGLSDKVAMVTDGRFSGGSHGFVIGHVTPEAYDGGVIALVEDGDVIIIDATDQTLTLKVSDTVLTERRKHWQQPEPYATKGVLAKYAKLVSTASQGAITDQ
jgi:dihydroxy-acid dehydratase